MTPPCLDPDFETPDKTAQILRASAQHCERFALALAKTRRGDALSGMWARISGILEDAARDVRETATEHSPDRAAGAGGSSERRLEFSIPMMPPLNNQP